MCGQGYEEWDSIKISIEITPDVKVRDYIEEVVSILSKIVQKGDFGVEKRFSFKKSKDRLVDSWKRENKLIISIDVPLGENVEEHRGNIMSAIFHLLEGKYVEVETSNLTGARLE